MTPFSSGYGQAIQITASSTVSPVRFQGQAGYVRIKAAGAVTVYFTADDANNQANGYPLSAETFEAPLKARELWFTGSGQVNILALIAG